MKIIALATLITVFFGDANNFNKYMETGIVEHINHDYHGAIYNFNRAIELDPNISEPYYHRGLSKLSLKDYNGALGDFNKAIEINPNRDGRYYHGLGNAKNALKLYAAAINDYTVAIELGDNAAVVYFDRGVAQDHLRDFRGAISNYNQVIALDKNSTLCPTAYFFKGMDEILIEQKESGCSDLSKAGELGCSDAYTIIKQDCK